MADVSRLPGPNADFWDWQLRGSCRGTDSDLFFHPEGERGQARSSREESAKEVCLHCPVCKPCQEHALKVHEPYGVWGGMTEEEREEHYAREKQAVRAARLAAVAAAASVAKAGGKTAKVGRKAPTKVPAKASGKSPVVVSVSAPANAITLTRPGNNTGPGAASAARGAKAKAAKS
jgi:WhiB family transcriptional regulator, redox-sensing transcriptional regulator